VRERCAAVDEWARLMPACLEHARNELENRAARVNHDDAHRHNSGLHVYNKEHAKIGFRKVVSRP
jgi:hypothetical protein